MTELFQIFLSTEMLYAKKIIHEIDLDIIFPHIFFRYEKLFVYDDVEERVKDVDN